MWFFWAESSRRSSNSDVVACRSKKLGPWPLLGYASPGHGWLLFSRHLATARTREVPRDSPPRSRAQVTCPKGIGKAAFGTPQRGQLNVEAYINIILFLIVAVRVAVVVTEYASKPDSSLP